ncbi:MAG TPA: hypothetical protein VK196_20535 [Magnetospirillum sp.]|nr:hypothetical protein [Magnetospirillum sp.]
MVDTVESTTQVKAAGPLSPASATVASTNPADYYYKAIADAIVLSEQGRQYLSQMTQGKTVAEAWLDQLTAPPDFTQMAIASQLAPSTGAGATGGEDNGANDAAMRQSMKQAMRDLNWLFDAMSPPKVDIDAVAKALAKQMAIDAVGTNPPVQQVVAQAEQTGTTPALYVENLSVTVGRGGTSASVDRVALTTMDPSLGTGTAAGQRPVVLDVGGDAQHVATDALGPQLNVGQTDDRTAEAEKRALLIVRQGGRALPEGTLHVKLDVLLPL